MSTKYNVYTNYLANFLFGNLNKCILNWDVIQGHANSSYSKTENSNLYAIFLRWNMMTHLHYNFLEVETHENENLYAIVVVENMEFMTM